ncbi:MAG: hypothetical protein Q4Q06_01845 [Bacteroidota bacterium]|nr:hypothetical protein [Bacteroidota bacterium]
MKKTAKKTDKKRLIVSYKNLPEKDRELFNTTYEEGYTNFIQKISKPDGTPMFLVPLETEEIMYMVKVDVKIDEHINDEDFDKDVFKDKEEETTLDDLESGKDTHSFKLVHGDYSQEEKIIEEQANKDMIESDSMYFDEEK